MQSYGIVGANDNEVEEAIQKKYASKPEQLSYAQEIAVLVGDYSRNLPKSFNQEKTKKREFRRNAKRTIYNQAKEKIQPKGFIATFFFWAILSGIVSWFVQKLMNNYFNESPKGMFYDLGDEEDAED